MNFDLRDESGATLPHLELRQNQDLTFALLVIWARHVLATPPVAGQMMTAANGTRSLPKLVDLDDDVIRTLCFLVYGARPKFQAALERLRRPSARDVDQLRQLADDERFRYVLELLA